MKNNKSYLLIAAVLAFLFTLTPTQMLAQENLVDRLNKALNLKLPDNYDAEARKFIEENQKFFKDKDVIDYTEKFIVEQMKEDLGINKQDQYLFLLDGCFKKCTGDFIYYGNDGNDKRLDDFLMVKGKMKQCREKYGEGLKAYLDQLSAEARQQSAEALTEIVNKLIWFYRFYHRDPPPVVYEDEIKRFKDHAKNADKRCKELGIDYKAILRKELGDEQKVKDLLKFYEIE